MAKWQWIVSLGLICGSVLIGAKMICEEINRLFRLVGLIGLEIEKLHATVRGAIKPQNSIDWDAFK
jgi:hypothetical protein